MAIGSFQLVQGKLADMYVGLNAARAYVYAVAAPATAAKPRAGMRRARSLAAETATRIALDAVQLLGGNGYINEFPAGRLLRDAKLYEIGAGTSEIRRWLIGREASSRSERGGRRCSAEIDQHDPVVIVGAARTAMGALQGALADFSAP